MAEFPDIEAGLLDWLEAIPAFAPDSIGLHADTETPPNLADRLPFVRVSALGGSDDRVTDAVTVDIDVYADIRASARTWAEMVREGLRETNRVGSVIIDSVDTEARPTAVPTELDNVWQFRATYRITMRRSWA